MHKIKTAVVGVGYLGKFHAQKFAALPQSEFVAVVDVDGDAAARAAGEHGVRAVTDYRQLMGEVDAVSIVVPTQYHFEIASAFLQAGVHVLVEKPITVTTAEADGLIELAGRHGVLLQVGHLERFNSVVVALEPLLDRPRFVESLRLAPFRERGTEVSVVLDLMIHDIDIIQNVARSPIARIDANGASVLTDEVDIANARIQFENGCVANVTASRVSMKTERRLHVFQHDSYASIDLQHRRMKVLRRQQGPEDSSRPTISMEERAYGDSDALKLEIAAFLRAIADGTPASVSGEDGKRALETAIAITDMVTGNAV